MTNKIKISSIKPNPDNPRIVKDDKFYKLVESIKQFGEKMFPLRPIVVDENNIILGGNMRYKALKHLKYITIPDTWIKQTTNLTDDEKKEFIIKDNVGFGLWDWDLLSSDWDADLLDSWGMDIPEFKIELEAKEDEFNVPDGGIETNIVLGDLIEIGEHRLLCGDSTDSEQVAKLMNGEKADMVFTDPPYGVSFVGIKGTMYQRGKKKGKDSNKQIKGDELRGDEISDIFSESLSNGYLFTKDNAPFYIFFAINKSEETLKGISDLGLEIRNWLIWDKGNVGFHAMGAQYKPNYESFLYCFKDGNPPEWKGNQHQQTIWRHSVERLGLHPTMKPITLISQAIGNHKTNLLLDLFLGSGSTMCASHQLNKKCYGLELDPKYCQVIVDRMIKLDSNIKVKINNKEYKTEEVFF